MAKIKFAYSEQNSVGNAKKWNQVKMDDIFITGRIAKKLLDPNNKNYEMGKNYVSVNTSRKRFDNPFTLMRKFSIDENAQERVSYYLKGVEENGSYLVEKTMPNGEKAVTRVWKKDKPDFTYMRYVDLFDIQKEYHLKQLELNEEQKSQHS